MNNECNASSDWQAAVLTHLSCSLCVSASSRLPLSTSHTWPSPVLPLHSAHSPTPAPHSARHGAAAPTGPDAAPAATGAGAVQRCMRRQNLFPALTTLPAAPERQRAARNAGPPPPVGRLPELTVRRPAPATGPDGQGQWRRGPHGPHGRPPDPQRRAAAATERATHDGARSACRGYGRAMRELQGRAADGPT